MRVGVHDMAGRRGRNATPTFTAQATGEKEGSFMKTRIEYTDEPMGDLRVVKDFLPPPDQLVLKEDNVKVTISLKKFEWRRRMKKSLSLRTADLLPC
jgi:hypothetical protein